MAGNIAKSLWLLFFSLVVCCLVYPLILWVIGQTGFPFEANGSLVNGPDGKPVGSLLIAEPFTRDEYFWPRPSAASYDASASASSTLAASNYLLRNRIAQALGPIVRYAGGPKAGQPVAPDIEAWFQRDRYHGAPHIVAQWADLHNELAQAWVGADPSHAAYVAGWVKAHPELAAKWAQDNPGSAAPAPADLSVVFFADFSSRYPGRFPSGVAKQLPSGKTETIIEPVATGVDIQATFFDMWRNDHPQVDLAGVPADMVTTSGSGLDPHITLDNAEYQLDRVAKKWAADTRRDPGQVRKEIQQLVTRSAFAPMGGLFGEKIVNVLQLNLELSRRYGRPPA